MRTNPVTDSFAFLIGNTPDHDALGWARYLVVALYWAALIGGCVVAYTAWTRDPAQRNGRNVAIWLFRMLIGTMWLQGSVWKLPLPVAGGFKYWTEQLVEHSFLPIHAQFVQTVLLPNIAILDPVVFVTETLLGLSLMLGAGVRIAGVVGILFTINLWIGLYHRADEWPWNYVFLMFVHGFFVLDRAGECLGLDGLRRMRQPVVRRAYVR